MGIQVFANRKKPASKSARTPISDSAKTGLNKGGSKMKGFMITLKNIVTFLALRNMIASLKSQGFGKWLYYELNPSWYQTGPKTWERVKAFLPEVRGWIIVHPLYGLTVMAVSSFLVRDWSWKTGVCCIILTAFIVEIAQFLKAQAQFLNPVNSLIDMATWTAGGWALYTFVLPRLADIIPRIPFLPV